MENVHETIVILASIALFGRLSLIQPSLSFLLVWSIVRIGACMRHISGVCMYLDQTTYTDFDHTTYMYYHMFLKASVRQHVPCDPH